MSSESIDLLWNESIKKLKELIKKEEETSSDKSGAFQYYAGLYIRYNIILSDFNLCYDSSIQPQKRSDIKCTIEYIICRIINLRHLLTKLCPVNPESSHQAPLPWEYLQIDQQLKELCVAPSQLEIFTPSYFSEENQDARDSAVASLLQQTSSLRQQDESLKERDTSEASTPPAAADDNITEPDEDNDTDSDSSSSESSSADEENILSEEEAALRILSIIRGHISRKKTAEHKLWLDSFVGLSITETNKVELDKMTSNLTDIRNKRQNDQQYCKENYENDLHRIKNVVREEEGFSMKNKLRDERLQWITEHTVSNNSLPDSFEEFYKNDDAPPDDQKNEEAKGKANGKQKKDATKGSKDTKSKDKKDTNNDEVEPSILAALQTLLDPLKICVQTYEERWMHRSVGPDREKAQYHDVELAKDLIVRDKVRDELTVDVEEKLLSNIVKIKAVQEIGKKKSKKDGKKGKGKAKGKKGGKKGKKDKPLPGAKLTGLNEMSVDEMLAILVQHNLITLPKEQKLSDFIGGYENACSKLGSVSENWVDPSAYQLRKTAMDHCILPFGSTSIKETIQEAENIRSILLNGPEGSGKSCMVQTIASEIRALVINLSSSTIGSSFEGKEGATKLIHMAFTVAKEKSYAPVIIHLDDCHEFFMGKSKRGGGGGSNNTAVNTDMQRFQKDLLIYKNQALKKDDRVLVIGCTNMPELADTKLLKWKGPSGKPEKQGFFECALYFPRANHADRAMLWKEFIQRRMSSFNDLLVSETLDCTATAFIDLNYSALASMSDGFTAGQISSIVDSVLIKDRVKNLGDESLCEKEFVLSSSFSTFRGADDDIRFINFTRVFTSGKSKQGDKKDDAKKKKK